jgi:glutamate 5-kinase
VIANGKKPDTLAQLFAGEPVGTIFISSSRLHGKKRWIAYAANVRGRIMVNAGARDAILRRKASLLASGIVGIEHEFEALDVVSIVDADGREFARGLANCASRDIGANERSDGSREKKAPLVGRDNIVILGGLPD